eukprot:COSAG06_NODE_17792_length_921_cov_1.181265_1_plen_50_part_01
MLSQSVPVSHRIWLAGPDLRIWLAVPHAVWGFLYGLSLQNEGGRGVFRKF